MAKHTWQQWRSRYFPVASKVTLHAAKGFRLDQRLLDLSSPKIFPNTQFTSESYASQQNCEKDTQAPSI